MIREISTVQNVSDANIARKKSQYFVSIKMRIMLSEIMDKNSADKNIRRTKFSADKNFRRTKFSAPNQNFVSLVRRIFFKNNRLLTRNNVFKTWFYNVLQFFWCFPETFSADKNFRRTKFSAPNQIFGNYVRRIFVR